VSFPGDGGGQRLTAAVKDVDDGRTDDREQRYAEKEFAHLVEVGFWPRKHLLDARNVTSDVQAVHQCVMDFDRERHQRATVFVRELAERDLRNRVFASPTSRV